MPYKDEEKQRLAKRESYLRNREQVLAGIRRQRAANKAWLDSLKDQACLDCGLSWPSFVMEFHHRDSNTKDKNVSWLIYNASRQRVLDEIDKCDLICANCHRIREYRVP